MKRTKISAALRGLTVAAAAFVAVCGWHHYAALKVGDDVRRAAAHEWANNSVVRSNFLAKYTAACEQKAPVENDKSKVINRPLTYKECAENVAQTDATSVGLSIEEAESLGAAIERATDRIVAPAPLRWL